MTKTEIHEPSERLLDLIFMALDMGIHAVRPSGGPMTPFLVTPGEGQRPHYTRVDGNSLVESLAKAHSAVAELSEDVGAYAIAADGYLPEGDAQLDAIIVEAGERGCPVGFIFAQRYHPAGGGRNFEVIGRPAIIREEANRFGGI